MTKFFLK
jgi:hypothetical protein